MNTLQHSVVHRLPHSYRKGTASGRSGTEAVMLSINAAEDDLTGLCLLSHQGEQAWEVMTFIKEALAEIQLECCVVEWEGQPCLFVARHDEPAATCRLKNFGVCIAETFRHRSA
ncbi:YejG family protein [Erwinia oleae]|uniref:hypothetical protein n=1 Tax=Erwinia oleae TaxID=796334 RepID=UPI000556677B|nr:hypothetical protein [Erwinia oleae]